jgi:hypothetical protein
MNSNISNEYEDDNRKEVVINIIWANCFGLIVLIISVIIFGVPFFLLWGEKFSNIKINSPVSNSPERIFLALRNSGFIFLIFILLIITHELIHGLFFAIFSKNRLKSIKIGIMPARKLFSPYCNCKEKLEINHYRIAVIMPLVLMGIIPAVIAVCVGKIITLFWSILMVTAAGGDILIFLKTLKERKKSWILDHPSEVGYYIYRSPKE